MCKRWSVLAIPLLLAPYAQAEDLSADALSSLSSVGSSTVKVAQNASSTSSASELSSRALEGAADEEVGVLDDEQAVPGSHGKRIRYTSTNERGELVPVTGAFYESPDAKGVIAIAPGTRGLGDQCAPSAGSAMLMKFQDGTFNVNYEAPMVDMLLDAGYSVVVTDYIRHTYLNRVDQGHALIDAARAVAQPGEKIGFWGYSQGGGAAAAAAELVADYAPELNVMGTFSGAPPADPLAVLEQASAALLITVAGFAAASYMESYPEFREAMDEHLTDDGREWLEGLKTSCVVDAAATAPQNFTALFTTGGSFAEVARSDERLEKYLELNKLGKIAPSAPVMVMTNRDDDLVPEPQATQLANDYCALGADVEYRRVVVPGSPTQPLSSGSSVLTPLVSGSGHAAPLLLQTQNVIDWMDDRFAGTPMKRVCPSDHPDYEVVEGLNAVEITALVVALGALAWWLYTGSLPSLPLLPF